jgi:hypothetical protein
MAGLRAARHGARSPLEGFRDPWRGSTEIRISPHWLDPMREAKAGNWREAGGPVAGTARDSPCRGGCGVAEDTATVSSGFRW